MIQLSDIQTLLDTGFFAGGDVAGLVIFALALAVIMAVTKDTLVMVILLIPVMLILSIAGVISTTILFIMTIVMVLIIALTTSNSLFGDGN